VGKKIAISSLEGINWPPCCAKCTSKDNLTWASATSGRVTSVAPTLGGAVRIKSELLELSYPVCKAHAKGLMLANFITRNTSGFKMLRGFFYYMGAMSIILLVTLLARLVMPSPTANNIPPAMLAVFAFCALAFIAIVGSFRKLPLRIAKQSKDDTTISFANVLYANEFVKLNRQRIVSH
jgi:hypothetical protein